MENHLSKNDCSAVTFESVHQENICMCLSCSAGVPSAVTMSLVRKQGPKLDADLL